MSTENAIKNIKLLEEFVDWTEIMANNYGTTQEDIIKLIKSDSVSITKNKNIKYEELVTEKEVTENPIDKYLNNYKEHKLAEFCVDKDETIVGLEENLKKMGEQRDEYKEKSKCLDNIDDLYKKIKELPVDDYMRLHRKFVNTMNGTISTSFTVPKDLICTTTGCISSR